MYREVSERRTVRNCQRTEDTRGTFRYLFGTPDLKSEISHQIDVAYFLNSKHITLELTPFVNFIQNYIYLEKLVAEDGTEIIPDPVDGAPAFNIQRATLP